MIKLIIKLFNKLKNKKNNKYVFEILKPKIKKGG
jgi:hypothetical protein